LSATFWLWLFFAGNGFETVSTEDYVYHSARWGVQLSKEMCTT